MHKCTRTAGSAAGRGVFTVSCPAGVGILADFPSRQKTEERTEKQGVATVPSYPPQISSNSQAVLGEGRRAALERPPPLSTESNTMKITRNIVSDYEGTPIFM